MKVERERGNAAYALRARELVKDYPRPGRGMRSFFLPSWSREKVRALDGVSLSVSRGSIFGLLGTNGAGKTTFMKIAFGLLLPTSGTVEVLGQEPSRRGVRARMGMVLGDERSFYWRLSGRRNLEFFAALHDMGRAAAAERIETLSGLMDMSPYLDVPVSDYSAGMRQKMAVARALLHDPEVLFLDEPTRSLSPEAAYPLRDFISRELVERQGKSVVLATQDMEEAGRLCREVAVLHRGRLLFLGPMEELLRRGESLLGKGAGLGDVFVELVRNEEAGAGRGAREGERGSRGTGG